ncbi:monooxygenase [Aspergillus sclerotioniger CBS 115572]|uniref:Monooxygenase n=1 Tax=Aspergillus sclerotioniger CBS 115572 TaxID=1450535 RepID=A0A317VSS0_9EURO|nr:monooxygenase [Aspergillus sclerotioniger CBS 115572]PWY76077.1 monooxygenase [Aspergillus sclerotioniger CBS 115572]
MTKHLRPSPQSLKYALKILIVGSGCAGPALAFWLSRSGHHILVVERSPSLRDKGAQIDLRGQGIEVVKRMGLLDTIRDKCVDESGFNLVDSNSTIQASIKANTSGKGRQSLTSEFEIMRGDLVRIFHDATNHKPNVKYIFGMTVDHFTQDTNQVMAYFSNGTSDTFDLLVGADGQNSQIRKAITPATAPDPYLHLGFHAAYWFIPRIESDTNTFTAYLSPGGRAIFRRSHSPTESQAYFFLKDPSPELSSIHRASTSQQKQFWTQRFRSAGWETDRFLDGLQTTENFYTQEIVQIRTDTWYKGRVVLLGDAAHCPAVITGLGTTSSVIGAYVLAGEIEKNKGDLEQALRGYERVLRPYVNEIQKLSTSVMTFAFPVTWWGIMLLQWVARVVCWLGIPELVTRFEGAGEKGGWKVPVYDI